jgi:hypothetical protein
MSIDTTALLARTDVKAFFLHHEALTVIAAMFAHTRAVATTYGTDSAAYAEQADSLANCLSAVFGRPAFGNAMSITKDGDLSLYCNEDGAFVFGMVFHRDRSADGAEVVPGTWSLHS